MKAGADIEGQKENGWTALHAAAEKGYLECLEALLKAGANKEAQDENAWTPLYMAV